MFELYTIYGGFQGLPTSRVPTVIPRLYRFWNKYCAMHTSVEGNDTKKRDNTQDEDSDRSRQTIASPHIKKPQGVIAQTPVRK